MVLNVNEIICGEGYKLHEGLNEAETQKLKKYVEKKYFKHIESLSKIHLKKFLKFGISKYHLNSDLIDHNTAWPRKIRLFDEEGVKILKKTHFFNTLEQTFKEIKITNEIHNKEPEIVWRLVRPNCDSDVGPLHTDRWFWQINKWAVPKNMTCIKVWIMLGGESNKCGLRVVPKSQKNEKWKYDIIKRDGIIKPLFNEQEYDLNINQLETKPGNAVIFSYDLLHGGIVTRGNECRLSVEFTLFVPKDLS